MSSTTAPDSTIQPGSTSDPRLLLVYLAGPITGLDYAGAVGWRDEVAHRLALTAPHIRCMDPMRAKQHLADVREIGAFGHAGGLLDGHAVVSRDLFDVGRADVVLMNLTGARQTSIGCMVELGWARAHGKFVLVVLPDEERGITGVTANPHDHLFVHELASAVVGDIDAALAILETM
jgi:nucleoside 2-deoxyribosyltransferase